MDYTPSKVKILLEKSQFHFKKYYGQNFIVDENVIQAIVDKAGVDQQHVMEIGPGIGALTYALSKKAQSVICYEIDSTLKPLLEMQLISCDNVTIIYDDFLKRDIRSDLTASHYHVVANLPYYITTPILIKIIEDDLPVDQLVIMVQKEVGDRFKAEPGTKDYNSLSVYLHYYFSVKKLMDISRNVFMPKPNVDSIILQLCKKKELLPLIDRKLFFQLIRDSFRQKRKTLRNNLKGYPLDLIEESLRQVGWDLSVRAEQLSMEHFVKLANHLAQHSH